MLADPLADAEQTWVQFSGTSIVRALMDGRANIVELRVSGPGGQIDGLQVGLYLIHRQGPDRAQFEQAYSDDGGSSW